MAIVDTPLAGKADAESLLLYRKITRKLIPFLCLCYGGLPRSHQRRAGQAADGRRAAAERSGLRPGAGLFFVGYILFEVPSNLILQRVGAKMWIARIMITGAVVHRHHVRHHADPVLRHSLSARRGGGRFSARRALLPDAVVPDLSPRPHHRAVHDRPAAVQRNRRAALRLDHGPFRHAPRAARLAVAVLLEGIPSVLLGVLTFWLLPNTYQQANWLTPEEKQRIADDLARDDAEADHGKHSFRDGFFNLKVWMLGGIDFAILLSAYAMGFWMPTFIKTAGVTDITTIGYLTAIPSVAALLGMLLIGSSSDRLRERRWHIIVPFIVGALAMAGSTFFTHNALATVLLFSIARAAIIGAVPVFFSLPATFLRGTAAATGFALACSLANIAGLVSNSLMGLALDLTGKSGGALWAFAGCLLLSSLLVVALPAKVVNR